MTCNCLCARFFHYFYDIFIHSLLRSLIQYINKHIEFAYRLQVTCCNLQRGYIVVDDIFNLCMRVVTLMLSENNAEVQTPECKPCFQQICILLREKDSQIVNTFPTSLLNSRKHISNMFASQMALLLNLSFTSM